MSGSQTVHLQNLLGVTVSIKLVLLTISFSLCISDYKANLSWIINETS